MPTTNYKIACFASSTESGCCTSDAYHAQCYDPYCSDCVVDTNSSTGYGGVFPRSCTSGANCLGCVSGGTTCPGECKCHPGSGCGCYTPGTYSPIACTGGSSGCVETACHCCTSSGLLVAIASNYQATATYNIDPYGAIYFTSVSWSYVKSTCNSQGLISVNLDRISAGSGGRTSIQAISPGNATLNTSGTWTGNTLGGNAQDTYVINMTALAATVSGIWCPDSEDITVYQPS